MAGWLAVQLTTANAHADVVAAAAPPGQLVLCTDAPSLAKWVAPLPSVGAAAVPIKSAAGECATLIKGAPKPCDPNGAGCLGLGDCATAPKFTLVANGKTHNLKTLIGGKPYCVDAMDAGSRVQLYGCVNSVNQGWSVQGGEIKETFSTKAGAGVLGLSNASACKQWGPPPPPPPPPPSAFCPRYHPIHAGNVYDPSGPILDQSGTWHTWEDAGGWSHWWSKDLIHWEGNFTTSTNFGGDTGINSRDPLHSPLSRSFVHSKLISPRLGASGSVSPTPSGVYAFWPIMGGPGRGAIGSAKSLDPESGLCLPR